MSARRAGVAALAAAAVVLAAALAGSAPAGAHGDTGTLGLDVVVGEGGALEVRATVSYDSDGHPAEDATVTVTATAASGATAGPATLEPVGLGGYRGELAAPGEGEVTVRAEAQDPVASAERTVTVAASTVSTTPSSSPGADDDPAGGSTDVAGQRSDDSGVSPGLVAGVLGAVVLLGLGARRLVARSR